ncbi:diguanylate cyclase [Patescibacteria group bacterium]|nr:diguanylate cyclase [Patescibacteria group bacterium]
MHKIKGDKHMKKINDENGHPEGDKALKAIADAMREATRKTDVVARVGGDEFLAFLPGFSDGEVKDGIVAKILAGVEKAGYEVTVGSHYVDPNKTDVGSDALKDVMSRNGWAGKEHLARAVCVFDIAKKAADDQMYELKKSKKVGR